MNPSPDDVPLPGEWKTRKLSEFLSNEEFREIKAILAKGDTLDRIKGLKKYLNARKEKLEAKGIHPPYLAYMLEFLKEKILEK